MQGHLWGGIISYDLQTACERIALLFPIKEVSEYLPWSHVPDPLRIFHFALVRIPGKPPCILIFHGEICFRIGQFHRVSFIPFRIVF